MKLPPDSPEASIPSVIERLSGIQSRRIEFLEGIAESLSPQLPQKDSEQTSVQADFGLRSARHALEDAGISASEIDLVVFASSASERTFPGIGIEIATSLGAPGFAFDLNAGCSSATIAVGICEQYLRSGAIKNAMVVTAEFPTFYVNWKDRTSNFLFGDASSSLVLTSNETDSKNRVEVLSTSAWSKYSSVIRNKFGFMMPRDALGATNSDSLFVQDGPTVFKEVVRAVPEFMLKHFEKCGLKSSDIKKFWLHQANARLNEAILRRVVGEREFTDVAPSILKNYGNSASSGIVVAFHETKEQLLRGQFGYLCAFGAGYSAGGILVKRS